MRKQHPNKDIQAAIEHAMDSNWTWVPPGKSAHCFCRLRCGEGHTEHQMSIWSTPKSPLNHAKQIRRKVDQCLAMNAGTDGGEPR
jgi:hypothetical protein